MEETRLLKLLPRANKEEGQIDDHSDPVVRFRRVVSNVTKSALDCLNRISQREMQKESPSPTLMEDYFLLHQFQNNFRRRLPTRWSFWRSLRLSLRIMAASF